LFLMSRPPPVSSLLPSTPLFRSAPAVWAGRTLLVHGGADRDALERSDPTAAAVWSTGVWLYRSR